VGIALRRACGKSVWLGGPDKQSIAFRRLDISNLKESNMCKCKMAYIYVTSVRGYVSVFITITKPLRPLNISPKLK